ncbi:MAG: FAD-dependent oxidoreductase [Brachymonas sp.]
MSDPVFDSRVLLLGTGHDLVPFWRHWVQWWTHGQSAPHSVSHCVWQCEQPPSWGDVLNQWSAWRARAPFLPMPAAAEGAMLDALQRQWWGLLPGWHRMVLHEERLILHVVVAPMGQALLDATGTFDAIRMHWPDPATADPALQNMRTVVSALTARARHHTRLTMQLSPPPASDALLHHLASKGWQDCERVPVPRLPSTTHDTLECTLTWAPRWQSPAPSAPQPQKPRRALIIGAGLSGAACAYSLARRGWKVVVLDRSGPASGASGLPVGLVVPHTSADDTRISQISRAGIRCTLARAADHLSPGTDWAPTGVVEHCVEGRVKLPRTWTGASSSDLRAAATPWACPAPENIRARALLPDAPAVMWHACAAWIKPPALVQALLSHPGIEIRTDSEVAALSQTTDTPDESHWQAYTKDGRCLGSGNIVVLAAAHATQNLLAQLADHAPQDAPMPARGNKRPADTHAAPFGLHLHPLRGQIAWGWEADVPDSPTALPSLPVNGKGSMAAHIPWQIGHHQGMIWTTGSTFVREDDDASVRASEMPAILDKLRILHPRSAAALEATFASRLAHGWAGVRATLPDRLPAVGALLPEEGHRSPSQRASRETAGQEDTAPASCALHGVYLCCGMGARGLTLAMLSGELLAAQLDHEPLPVEKKLAAMLAASRWQ